MPTDLFLTNGSPIVTRVPNGQWAYYPGFYSQEDSGRLIRALATDISWGLHKIRIFGRWVQEPRQTAWFGDPGAIYTYSGVTMKPAPWTPLLAAIRQRVEKISGQVFNSVLLNLYRDGDDHMGWHADDEPELGVNPTIASLSLGAERRFCLKHRTLPGERHELRLESGSLLVMSGDLQHHWLHSVPKSAAVQTPRVNLTFRKIIPA